MWQQQQQTNHQSNNKYIYSTRNSSTEHKDRSCDPIECRVLAILNRTSARKYYKLPVTIQKYNTDIKLKHKGSHSKPNYFPIQLALEETNTPKTTLSDVSLVSSLSPESRPRRNHPNFSKLMFLFTVYNTPQPKVLLHKAGRMSTFGTPRTSKHELATRHFVSNAECR